MLQTKKLGKMSPKKRSVLKKPEERHQMYSKTICKQHQHWKRNPLISGFDLNIELDPHFKEYQELSSSKFTLIPMLYKLNTVINEQGWTDEMIDIEHTLRTIKTGTKKNTHYSFNNLFLFILFLFF